MDASRSPWQAATSKSISIRPDPLAPRDLLKFGGFRHGLHVHVDVLHDLDDQPRFKKRLRILLDHLAAQGRTSVVKGCRGNDNEGWLRSPLGGSNGKQFYLWWTAQGSPQAASLQLAPRDVVVRCVRHHDDHAPLGAGDQDDYFPVDHDLLDDEKILDSPWTSDQLQFIESEAPVRLVHGRPGSGKTTVLWKAVETRGGQRVLYLTWSRALAHTADEHFDSFAPADVFVDTRDFTSFLGEIRGQDVARQTLGQSFARLAAVASRLPQNVLGPWVGRMPALYGEIRGHLIGRALPGDDACLKQDGVVRLSDEAYLRKRGVPVSERGIGRAAAGSLLKALDSMRQQAPLAELFPELAAAEEAFERLRESGPPASFADIDRVVVDEVQDLTLLEMSVVTELCRALAKQRGYSPWLLVAGDEGQTVRPSGFDWGPLADLLARRVSAPRKHALEENLLCPQRIAAVIDRASKKYTNITKAIRPTRQGGAEGGQHVEAWLVHVDATRAAALDILERLEEVEGLVVVSCTDTPADWIPRHLRDLVLTPAEAKGLEYQSVCVLDPGRSLADLDRDNTDEASLSLEEHARRTSLDQLRVALSRATETLVFVDVDATPQQRALSLHLLENPVHFDGEDLLDHLTHSEILPEDRVRTRADEALALIEGRPARAWRRAHQAVKLLGDPDLPNGVANRDVRLQAHQALLTVAARLLVDGVPPEVERGQITEAAEESLLGTDLPAVTAAFRQLDRWAADRSASPIALLDATLALRGSADWLRRALVPAAQALRRAIETAATDPLNAEAFTGDVEGWLRLTQLTDQVESEARRLRILAVGALLDTGKIAEAEALHGQIAPPDHACSGRLKEALGRHEQAARAFESAGRPHDARRNWRLAGRWERALPHAVPGEQESDDLTWLVKIEELLQGRPANQAERLTPAERKRLHDLLDRTVRSKDNPARGRQKGS